MFTTIGSSTRQLLVRNQNDGRLRISSIVLEGGSTSQFIVNVDGLKGTQFSELEIAAHDSMYIFVQVNVNPTNANSPVIVTDRLHFYINGNEQIVHLEAWGQDAYYHKPTSTINFQDGTYLAYSRVDTNNVTMSEVVWKKDKPHVIYGYLVVDSLQKLTIEAGVQVYLTYKAGLWVYKYGSLKVKGQKGNEVVFQSARRERDYMNEPGEWDRIWINEGSDDNSIDYAIIKNGYVGVQAEILGNLIGGPGTLRITNTKIQNMSLWGMYVSGYRVDAGNVVVSNCKEHALNIQVGGDYRFLHCTFANFWNRDTRDKACVNMTNYTSGGQPLPLYAYFGNCIVDGKLTEEITMDYKGSDTLQHVKFSNCYLKTIADITDKRYYINAKKGPSLSFKDPLNFNFAPAATDTAIRYFDSNNARNDVMFYPLDILQAQRELSKPTAGAYEF